MVSSPHALASQAGLRILEEGGNAADAIVAIAAALAVLYPHMTGIGGDVFFIYYDAKKGELHGYNGSGSAAALASLQFYRDRGHATIPERGAAAALTVPGTVDAWFAMVGRFGSMEMHRILAPAISYAKRGAPAARSFVSALQRLREVLAADAGAADLFLSNAPHSTGDKFSNPALGRTLESIAQFGRSWFYEGDGARAISTYAERIGSPLRTRDLAEHHGFFCDPIAGMFFGCESVTMPPNSQGMTLLVAQQVYEAFPRSQQLGVGTPASVHAEIESIRFAIDERDASVGDPRLSNQWRVSLQLERTTELAQQLDPYAARPYGRRRPDAGDTAYFACVDSAGNAVSFIQSLFHGFGAGVVVPELGSALQNRGASFELSEGRLRSLVPGRLPFHTLMPCMLLREGKPLLVYGSMGGEAQPQIALQISTNVLIGEMDPQTAIDQPRWRWGREIGESSPRLHVEARMGDACIAGLRARGHDVVVTSAWDESMGHASAIAIDHTRGVLTGGADPRSDGAAVGY